MGDDETVDAAAEAARRADVEVAEVSEAEAGLLMAERPLGGGAGIGDGAAGGGLG